ncbi:cilia- and flagella-associated protein 74 isoform X2 [Phascolarctos cinereus]|uniref:Cilia- and flagella-associated protein 74 isoform X2 n=1 Tax=Phascolarctos cinereus TaxID=38626 RepID=A0A6P5JBC7_PHACI|nr:cilia- and flagella-associated protein 74 isoform X2 [Phascolarctos cinereus]
MADFRFQDKDDLTEIISNLEEFKRDGFGDLPGEKESDIISKKTDKKASFDFGWKYKKKNVPTNRKKKVTYKDRVRTLHLRRNINKLDRIHEEKKFFLLKTKQDLDASLQRIESIQKQKVQVETEIQMEKEAHNSAAVFRLQAMLRRLCTELEHEKELEVKISSILKEKEENMRHIEINEGKFSVLRENLEVEEAKLAQLLQGQAEERLIQAKMAAVSIDRKKTLQLQKAMEREKSYELHHQKMISEAKKNHKIAVQFLRTTLAKVRKKEASEEKKSQEYMKRRMDAIIALKNNITTNRDTLQKLRAWEKARAHLVKEKEEAEKEGIAAQGGDAIKQTLHEKRNMELDIRRQLFEEEQKIRKCEIVSRLLKEEADDEKRKQRQLDLENGKRWMIKAKKLPSLKEKRWQHFMKVYEEKSQACTSVVDSHKYAAISEQKYCSSIGSTDDEFLNIQEEETLTEPEIMGLWSEKYKPYKVPKDEVKRKPVGGTKMEQDILANTLEKLRSGMVHKQVVSGREFKGCPFYSKPDLIHFKNFDVGKTYKKKMTLINASYTINYCKLVGVEDHLKDFITIHFDPPGPMSAGISCEVFITFKPMINKELEGNITFLAQTGSFSIPLKCTTKKCALSLDKNLIDFGTYVVGEIVSRTITLENHGALGTKFQVHTEAEKCDYEAKSLNTTDSTLYSLDDKVTEEKNTTHLLDAQSEVYCPPTLDTIPGISSRVSATLSEEPYQEHAVITIEGPTSEGAEINSAESQAEIKLGEVTTNEIGPFSSVKIPIIFTPMIPGPSEAKFQLTFKNPDCQPLCFTAIGVAIIVPVWVPKPNVDLNICMYDRLYQDAVIIQTRSKAALRLKFEVCEKLRKHIELLPETGYIQAQSSYSVQLKFLPRLSLPEDAGEYFDKETRVLQAPMTIRVADQKRPVEFTVHAILTTSDLEMDPKEVNFGYCTIYEAVYTKVTLTNKSLLPQEFGFISTPKYVEIQPNDGFGTILPLQSLPLDVIFKPSKAKEYDFQLVCISEINREFTLSCKAIGVHPPLELSHYRVKFAATALFDMSTVTLYVINSHINMNPLTHSVPRIGSGEIAPVGPTSFEFLLPDKAPIMIIPSVGTVLPGKKCMIEVIFKPVLSETTIKKEVVKMRNIKLGVKSSKKEASSKKGSRMMFTASLKAAVRWLKPRSPHKKERRKQQKITMDSEEYLIAKATLTRNFQEEFHKYVIPCVIASGDIKEKKETVPMNFSPYNTLYLELYCPTVAPSIVVTSDNGKTVFNFGDVAVGHRGIKKITIENVCPEYLDLQFSILNPYGPFILLSPCCGLQSKESKNIAVSFSPRESNMFLETLDIMTKRGTLTLTMMGKGVASTITCSIEGDVLNMGYVIVGESATSAFKRVSHQILLKGAAREHMMFVEGGDPLDVTVESLAVISSVSEEERREDAEETKAIILTLEYIQMDSASTPATRELRIGCIRTSQPTLKKSIDFSLDSIHSLQHKGFTVEPSRGTVDRGQTKTITVSWVPTPDFDPDHPLVVTTSLILRGDVKEIYRLVFIAHVVSEWILGDLLR